MSATTKAVIHLGEKYKDNLVTNRNTDFEALKALFDITQKLLLEQKHEIKQMPTTESIYSQVVESKSTCLFRFPALSGKHVQTSRIHEEQLQDFQSTNEYKEFIIMWNRRRTIWPSTPWSASWLRATSLVSAGSPAPGHGVEEGRQLVAVGETLRRLTPNSVE